MPRVLVVEDEEAIRVVLAGTLVEEGYDVGTASNGLQALEALKAQRPDVVVLDLNMPEMSGEEFVLRCRSLPGCAGMPIIVVSATHGLASTAGRLRPFGVRAVLAKPFEVDALLAIVQRYASARTRN